MYYNPSDLLSQHLRVREEIEKTELKRITNGYNIVILTGVDIQEIVKLGSTVIKLYGCVFSKKNLERHNLETFLRDHLI